MTNPIIFISHSTSRLPATDLAVQLKEALAAALQAKGWQVFLDSHSISEGDLWRSDILQNLAMARAGIILLNEDAAKSDWVKAEALIMCFRKSIDFRFPLVPVLLPGADVGATFLKSYEPFKFNEIQRATFEFDRADSVDDFASKIAGNANLESGRLSSPTGTDWVQRLVNIFADLKPETLCQAADRMKLMTDPELLVPVPPEHLCLRMRWALANLLHHESLDFCMEAIKILLAALNEDSARKLERHVLSKWVDNESAELLLLAAHAPEQQGLLAVNTARQDVVDQYNDRLRSEIPITGPIFFPLSVSRPNGDYDETGLMELVDQAISKKLVQKPLTDENGNELPLDQAVALQLQPNKFGLAMLPIDYCSKSLLEKLRSRFPRIIFLAQSGAKGELTSECVAAGGRILTPPLTFPKVTQLSILSNDWRALFEMNFPPTG